MGGERTECPYCGGSGSGVAESEESLFFGDKGFVKCKFCKGEGTLNEFGLAEFNKLQKAEKRSLRWTYVAVIVGALSFLVIDLIVRLFD